jgi:excisionase family DNA binding protein
MTQRQRQDRHLHAADEPEHRTADEPRPLTQDLWSVEKTAKFLDIPKGTLYQWISHCRLRSYKVGGSRKFDPVDVRAYLRENVTEPVEHTGAASG